MPIRQFLRPYAALADIHHAFDVNHLDIYLVFKYPMDQTVKPANAKWICEVNEVVKTIDASTWQDEFTMLLTTEAIAALPTKVTVEYNGPDSNLRTTWFKQWEPWGAIISVELPPVATTRIFSTGPDPQDDVDVTNVNILFLDCSVNAIVIGGLVGGINGQVLHVARLCAAANNATIEHNEGGGNQDILLHAGADETLFTEYGGWTLACNGTNWYDISHAKHV